MIKRKPNIYIYEDYKKFLNDYILSLPKNGRGALSKIATTIGCHRSYVTLILKGERDFSLEQIYSIGRLFMFSESESDYLICLLQIKRSVSSELRDFFVRKKTKISVENMKDVQKSDSKMSSAVKEIYFQDWSYSATKLVLGIKDNDKMQRELKSLGISSDKLEEIVDFLLDNEIISAGDDGKYWPSKRVSIESDDYNLLKSHHINWREQALSMINESKGEKGDKFVTCPMVISEDDYRQIKDLLVIFVGKISQKISKSSAEKLCCLNIDFFSYEKNNK